jgi:DNA-binding transcriptional MerR regulator
MITIGRLAHAGGVPTSTIRYWERRGLVAPTEWQAGQRRYGPEAVERVALLRLCQDAGFTLDEIARMLAEAHTNPPAWRDFVRAKRAAVQESLTRLERVRDMLDEALSWPEDDISDSPKFLAAVDGRMAEPPTTACGPG